MPATQPELIDALRPVEDPELRRSIVDLGMVREASRHRRGARIVLALPVAEHPRRHDLAQAVTVAVQRTGDVDDVDVSFTVMDEDEVSALRQRLAGDAGPGRPVPFVDPSSPTRSLLIASGKGGVGKSSVTTNLSIALARRGHRVAVVDADVWGFSIPRMLGVDRQPLVLDGVLIPPEAYGVRCISMGFFAREDQPVIWRGPMLHKALEQFLSDVWWDDPDFLVVDLPPGTGDISLSLAQFLPRAQVYIVTTPQPAAQKVAQRAAFMARKVNLDVKGVIENMSWFTGDDGQRYELFGSGGGDELATLLGVPLLGQVPLVPELREGGDTGRPITVTDPEGEASRVFAEIAERVDVELKPTKRYSSALKLA